MYTYAVDYSKENSTFIFFVILAEDEIIAGSRAQIFFVLHQFFDT